jgi:hypothetical protein
MIGLLEEQCGTFPYSGKGRRKGAESRFSRKQVSVGGRLNPKKLQPIIARSGHWGRIKAEVVCAMTSLYAIALYELVQLRANLQKCVETFPLDRFRELMGVPPGKLTRGNDLTRWVLDTAALEVNGLSDCRLCIIRLMGASGGCPLCQVDGASMMPPLVCTARSSSGVSSDRCL